MHHITFPPAPPLKGVRWRVMYIIRDIDDQLFYFYDVVFILSTVIPKNFNYCNIRVQVRFKGRFWALSSDLNSKHKILSNNEISIILFGLSRVSIAGYYGNNETSLPKLLILKQIIYNFISSHKILYPKEAGGRSSSAVLKQ